jgi:hypothetical protein
MTSLRKRILLEGCLLFCVGLVALIYSFLPSKGTFALEGWIIFLSLLLVLAAFWLLPRFSKVLCFKKEARHKLSKAFQAAIQTPEARQQTLKKAIAILLFVLFLLPLLCQSRLSGKRRCLKERLHDSCGGLSQCLSHQRNDWGYALCPD